MNNVKEESKEVSDCEIEEQNITVIDLDTTGAESFCEEPDAEDLLFKIKFPSKDKFESHKTFVVNALRNYYKQNDVNINFNEDGLTVVVRNETKIKEEDCSNIFVIDTTPTAHIASSVPSYKRTIKSVLKYQEKKKEANEESCALRSICFNCSGDHNMRECPEPRDQQKINKARKQYSFGRVERYHVDIEQRFAHLKPGVISKKLREALGIYSERHLPVFIYRMRELGYPPGWLEHSKVSHSGLSLFDSEGNAILESDQEDGEVTSEKHKYDIKKIISFPGFNTEPPLGCIDESRFYGCGSIQPQHQKEEFIKSLAGNVTRAYRKKKLKHLSAKNADESNGSLVTPSDMEIEEVSENILNTAEFVRPPPPLEPQPQEIPPPPPSPPPPERDMSPTNEDASDDMIMIEDDLSLEDLQRKQMELMAELQNASSYSTKTDDSLIDEIISLEEMDDNESQESISSKLTLNSQTDSQSKISTCSEPPNKKRSILGTPLLKFSPYDKLPAGESFSVGVSDVINFENLPDSTGKYEQMKTVLEKVRSITAKLYNENEN